VTTRIVRAPFAADDKPVVRLAVARYKELRETKRAIQAEQDALAEMLAAEMDERGAKELTVGGIPIARLTEYDMETVDVVALRAKHPKIAARFTRSTPVKRVEVP
jgi:hypothetical protein